MARNKAQPWDEQDEPWQGQDDRIDPAPRPDEAAMHEELNEEVRRALEDLPPEDRRILLERYRDERTLAQIALAGGWTAQAAWNQVHRALDRLREALRRRGFTPGP